MRMMALSYAEGGRESADWWSIGFSVGMLAAVLIGSAVRPTRGAPEASSPIKVRDPAGGLHTVFAQEIETEHGTFFWSATKNGYAIYEKEGGAIQLQAMADKEGVPVAIADHINPDMVNMLFGNARGMFGFSPPTLPAKIPSGGLGGHGS